MNIQIIDLYKTSEGGKVKAGTLFIEKDETGSLQIFEKAARDNMDVSDRRKVPYSGKIKADSYEIVKADTV